MSEDVATPPFTITPADLRALPLRERKKVRTRLLLLEVAHRLFLDEGYGAATIERICEEAEVSVATFHRHFESKERLALHSWHEFVEHAEEVFLGGRETSAIDLWRDYVPALWNNFVDFVGQGQKTDSGAALAIYELIQRTPELRAERNLLERRLEEILAVALARDAGLEPEDDTYSQIFAASLLSTTRIVFGKWGRRGAGDWVEVSNHVTDLVVDLFPPREEFSRSLASSDSIGQAWLLSELGQLA